MALTSRCFESGFDSLAARAWIVPPALCTWKGIATNRLAASGSQDARLLSLKFHSFMSLGHLNNPAQVKVIERKETQLEKSQKLTNIES